MQPNPSAEPRDRWLWWMCGLGLLAGLALGWRTIRSEPAPLPIATSLSLSASDGLRLSHPLPQRAAAADATGELSIAVYSGRQPDGTPVAEVTKPPVFDNGTQWLSELVNERLAKSSNNLSMRMRGWITFSAARTVVHVRSDDGYRIRFRNALGEDQKLEHWVDDVTEDRVVDVVAEPGRYQIEIEYFNGVGGYFFQFSANPGSGLAPATDSPSAVR